MFRREHHIHIATILQSLNSQLLDRYHCLFGGGTAIVLAREEYRESVDIDFLISNREGYLQLRNLMKEKGIAAVTRPDFSIKTVRDIRIDQYGIRTMLKVGDTEIKFEIVFESRLDLKPPVATDKICGVSILTDLDMGATKLLANSDRWSDDSVFSRDLIDLAMVGLDKGSLKMAIKKAELAYGASVQRDLTKAIATLAQRKGRLDECMDALKIDSLPKASLWKYIRDLER